MRLLADTHIVLWRMTGDPRLSDKAIELMDATSNTVEVSTVSIWEVAIKHRLDRPDVSAMPLSGSDFLDELSLVGLAPLPIIAAHAIALDSLPMHHRDPFDRLLIAQALTEPMFLLTHDSQLAAYGDFVIVV